MRIEALLGDTPRRHPGRVALSDGARAIPYADLGPLVGAEAQVLVASGGTRFALLADNGCGWALSDLALHHARRLNVPLPGWFTPAQLRHVLDDAGIDALVTDRPDEARARWPEFRSFSVSPVSGLTILRRELEPERLQRVPEGVVKVTYTSGSTAEPKGVCLTAASLDCVSRSLAGVNAPLGVQRHLCLMPLPTLLENLAGIHAPLRSGVTCLVPSLSATGMSYGALDPQRLLGAIGSACPESLILVPELLRLIVHAARAGHALPASLKFIAVGGASVSRSLLDEAASLRLPVYEGYGLSECASVVCLNTPDAQLRGSVGRPLPHARVRCDANGQLHVSGAVMAGYLGEDAPWGAREIATGDLGEIDRDGFVHIHGRMKNVFITSFGRNVSPEWIERELTHEPAIRHALVCGEARPFAAALLGPARPDLDAAACDIAVRRANERLPEYARVRRWACMPESPSLANGMLTANGRLRRERVLERFGGMLQNLFVSEMETHGS